MPFITTNYVLDAWKHYEYFGMIVYGPLRCGKSSFAVQELAEVYGDPWRNPPVYDWNAWKKWMTFLPEEFFHLVDVVQQKGKQAPCIVWDDAGLWASQYRWAEEFAKRISDYTSVAGTDFASIIFTTPDPRWLLKHIRDLPGGHNGRVSKMTGNPYQRTHRYMKIYEGWLAPDLKKSGVKAKYEEFYDVMLPDDVFQDYDKVRRRYAQIAKQRVLELLEDVRKRKGEEYAETIRQKIEREVGIELH